MIEEIPYAHYEKKINNESNDELLLNSELPVSIEIIPHKAIIIHELYNIQNIHTIEHIQMRRNREMSCRIKILLIISFFIPFVIVISSFRI